MSILDLTSWQDGFEDLPLKADQTWKTEWAKYLDAMVSKAGANAGMVLAGYSPPASIKFTFDKGVFESSLLDSDPNVSGLPNIANAFEAAMLVSLMVLTPPMTTPVLDTVVSTIVEPASIAVAKSVILATPPILVESSRDAEIIKSMRNAFLSLTYTVTGTAGGNPITLPAQGVQ